MTWFQRFFSRHRRYDDLSVSIQEHLEERIEELMESGLPPKEAAQKARLCFFRARCLKLNLSEFGVLSFAV